MKTVPLGKKILLLAITTLLGFVSGARAQSTNTATGGFALGQNTGTYNSAFGYGALPLNTGGSQNTSVGAFSLYSNRTGNFNTACGFATLVNSTGSTNSAFGTYSLYLNTTGNNNSAFGHASLGNNASGSSNTAGGYEALFGNTVGANNVAFGYQAMRNSATGGTNTAVGSGTLLANTSGAGNIALGFSAGSLLTGSNNICIGNVGAASESGVIRIGTTGTHGTSILAGNVGIGTSSPATKLTVNNAFYGIEHTDGTRRLGTYLSSEGGWFGTISNDPLNFYTNNGGIQMTLLQSGRVGIGTTTPGVTLDVVGTTTVSGLGTYTFFNSSNTTTLSQLSASASSVSIRASGGVLAIYFAATSDERIKNIQGRSDSAADLGKLLGIQITDYLYKDVVEKGSRPNKKVIAQQVEKVFPQAVNKSTDVVPDIYKKAPIKDTWVELATDLKVGDRVRLITEKGHRAVHEVLEVGNGGFRTDFAADGDVVFVYGREVKDFRTVDYDAISMLNVSATQELARKVDAKDAEIAALKKQLAALEARDHAREARLARLEAAGKDRKAHAVPASFGLNAAAK